MKSYGYGVVGVDGSSPGDGWTHSYEDVAKGMADDANKSIDPFYVNRRPWVAVPLFYEENKS